MNRYLIVTNDEYEYPVTELVGTKKVAEYLGVSQNYACKLIYKNNFGSMKYKAVMLNESVKKAKINGKVNPKAQRRWYKKYASTHDRSEHTSELQSPDHLVCRL